MDVPGSGHPNRMTDTQTKVPDITLNDGVEIPQLGFGVFQIPPAETAQTVARAFATGYRHIDTAAAYRNEAEVGQAFRASGLDRDEVFITTKCFNDSHGYDEATRALKDSLERLELDFVDLYLIHWPVPSRDRYVETWRAFIDLQREGLVRSIGVSNFQPEHLRRIVDETGVTPSVNQIELHPRFQQRGLRREHAERGIVTEAWSPLAQGEVLDDPTLTEIARGAGQDDRPGGPALAPAARQRRLPEVGHPEADRRELRALRLPPHRRRDGLHRRARRRRPRRAGPGHVRGPVAQPR